MKLYVNFIRQYIPQIYLVATIYSKMKNIGLKESITVTQNFQLFISVEIFSIKLYSFVFYSIQEPI